MTERLPGVRYAIVVYIVSDRLNVETVLTLEAHSPFPEVTDRPDLQALMAHLACGETFDGLLQQADDWRLMSDAEIKSYKESLHD